MESLIERRECRRALAWVELMSSHRRDTLLRKLIEPMVASGDGKELLEAVHAMDLHGLAWEVIGRTTKQRVRDGVFDEYWRADGIDIPDDRRSELQLEVVRALIEIGALERALTAAKSNHGRARLDALAETAVAFAAADRVNEALEIVALLDYDPRRETTRSAIVSTLVERKQFERALDLALRLGDKMFQKSDLLESIFDRLLELGAYEKARAAADAIPRAGLRTSLLASLALAISRHGRLAQGMALADELLGNLEAAVPTATLDHFFQRAAETLAANSQGGAATLTGMRIGDEKERRKPLRTRVALALQAGDIEGPLREVDALPAEPYSSHWIRAETRADIAAYLSAHGPREKALEVTRSACADLVAVVKLQDPLLIGLNTEAHKLLAKSWQLLAGRGAFQTVDELIAAVRAAEVAEDSVLALLAALLAEHGEVAWGIAVAEAIQDRGDRAEAFVGMAESLQRRGDGSVRDVAQRALSEATQLGGWRRAEMLGLVAAVSIRSGDRSTWKQTLSFGDDRNATENVAVVASHAALALMDSGAAAEAIELARAHASSATRASLCRLVLVLARGGCADDARAVTRSWRFDGADHLDRAAMLGEISALVGSAREAVTALHDIGDPATFRRVLRLVVQRNPPGTHTADVMRFWSEAVRGLERSTARATMLARIALELDATELRVHAAGVLTTALLESRNSDRGTVLEVVATGAPILARMDEGRLLNRILDEVTLVDSWWQTGPPPPSGATAMLAV
jgi:hypothetical protein